MKIVASGRVRRPKLLFSTKINILTKNCEIEAHSIFENGKQLTKISGIAAHPYFENEQFSTKIGEIAAYFPTDPTRDPSLLF